MRITNLVTAAAILFTAAGPAIAGSRNDAGDLVQKVRAEAGWKGVEVSKISRNDQTLLVTGTTRQGHAVVLTMDCAKLGFVCAPASGNSGGGFVAMAR